MKVRRVYSLPQVCAASLLVIGLLFPSEHLFAQSAKNACITKDCLTPVPTGSPSASSSPVLSILPSVPTTAVLNEPGTPDANLRNEVRIFLQSPPFAASASQLKDLADSTRLLLAFFGLCLSEDTKLSLSVRQNTFKEVLADATLLTIRNKGDRFQAPFKISPDRALLEFFRKSYAGSCSYLTKDPFTLAPAAPDPKAVVRPRVLKS